MYVPKIILSSIEPFVSFYQFQSLAAILGSRAKDDVRPVRELLRASMEDRLHRPIVHLGHSPGKKALRIFQDWRWLVEVKQPQVGDAGKSLPLVAGVGAAVHPHPAVTVRKGGQFRQEVTLVHTAADCPDFIFRERHPLGHVVIGVMGDESLAVTRDTNHPRSG